MRLAKDMESNLKLDTEAGTVPERIYIQSKRDQDDDPVLPTINISTIPFADIDGAEPFQWEPSVKEEDTSSKPAPTHQARLKKLASCARLYLTSCDAE